MPAEPRQLQRSTRPARGFVRLEEGHAQQTRMMTHSPFVIANPSWNRLFHVYDAIKAGIPFKKIQDLTKIDIWFLRQIEDMILTEKEVEKYTLETIPRDLLFEAKQKGYADRQVAHLLKCLESEVYKKRNALGIKRVYKLVDTCAGEFPAKTPYYYSTFEEENESVRSDRKKIVVCEPVRDLRIWLRTGLCRSCFAAETVP